MGREMPCFFHCARRRGPWRWAVLFQFCVPPQKFGEPADPMKTTWEIRGEWLAVSVAEAVVLAVGREAPKRFRI